MGFPSKLVYILYAPNGVYEAHSSYGLRTHGAPRFVLFRWAFLLFYLGRGVIFFLVFSVKLLTTLDRLWAPWYVFGQIYHPTRPTRVLLSPHRKRPKGSRDPMRRDRSMRAGIRDWHAFQRRTMRVRRTPSLESTTYHMPRRLAGRWFSVIHSTPAICGLYDTGRADG